MAARDPAALADQYRREQVMLAAALVRDLIRIFRALFHPADPGPSWAATRAVAASLVMERRRQSADAAARFYSGARRAAGLDPIPVAEPLELVEERLLASLDATGIGMFQRAVRAGASERQAVDRAGVTMSGAASRLVLEGGRSRVQRTVDADEDALGWIRITDADPCSWCAMLASRGAVYRSEATAGKAQNDRFVGEGQHKYHDHCGCTAVPVYRPDDPHLLRAEDLYDQWARETQGTSGAAAVNAWRRYWEGRDTPQPEGARGGATEG